MPHERLEGARIDATACQPEARRVAQNVHMDRELEASGHAKALDELLRAIDGQRGFALGQEQELTVRVLAQQCPDQPQLVALQAVNPRRAVLGPPNVDGGCLEVDLLRIPVMIRLRLQMLAPLSMRCSWKRRTSSGVAVSGERLSQAANRLQLEMWPRCVCGLSLRAVMSSIIR